MTETIDRRLRKKVLRALTIIVSLLLGLGLGELAMRLTGRTPYEHVGENVAAHAAMRAPDPLLGWRNRPGNYATDGGHRTSVLDDGSRATASEPVRAGDRVALIGGSFIFGHDLDDADTLAWCLQNSDPTRRYENYGVSGFGTYQSLLVVEGLLDQEVPPSLVIYGLIEHHKIRNIGKRSWLKHLIRTSSSSAQIVLPKCDVDENGELIRHEPVRYREWPLQRWSATVNSLQDAIFAAGDRIAMDKRQQITEAVLREMNRQCREKGARFIVLLLEPQLARPNADTQFLKESGIEYVDLRFPHTPELRVGGVGHPNEIVIGRWAEAIRERLGIQSQD